MARRSAYARVCVVVWSLPDWGASLYRRVADTMPTLIMAQPWYKNHDVLIDPYRFSGPPYRCRAIRRYLPRPFRYLRYPHGRASRFCVRRWSQSAARRLL